MDPAAKASVRSISLPASFKHFKGETDTTAGTGALATSNSHSNDQKGPVVEDGSGIESQNGMEISDDKSLAKGSGSRDDTAPGVDFQYYAEMLTEKHPKSFDFGSQQSRRLSGGSPTEEFHTPEGNFEDPSSSGKENVFVFSGSSESVRGRRRGATTMPGGVTSPVQEAGLGDGGTGEAASKEAAVLAQQLEFCSDDVSMEGE
jgi:hypothetical protein